MKWLKSENNDNLIKKSNIQYYGYNVIRVPFTKYFPLLSLCLSLEKNAVVFTLRQYLLDNVFFFSICVRNSEYDFEHNIQIDCWSLNPVHRSACRYCFEFKKKQILIIQYSNGNADALFGRKKWTWKWIGLLFIQNKDIKTADRLNKKTPKKRFVQWKSYLSNLTWINSINQTNVNSFSRNLYHCNAFNTFQSFDFRIFSFNTFTNHESHRLPNIMKSAQWWSFSNMPRE